MPWQSGRRLQLAASAESAALNWLLAQLFSATSLGSSSAMANSWHSHTVTAFIKAMSIEDWPKRIISLDPLMVKLRKLHGSQRSLI